MGAGSATNLRDLTLEQVHPVGPALPFSLLLLEAGATKLSAVRCAFEDCGPVQCEGGDFLVSLTACALRMRGCIDFTVATEGGSLHLTGCDVSSAQDDAVRVSEAVSI